MAAPEISVIVPVYDEVESLPRLAAEIDGALRPLGVPYEVIYVDDGSTDGSAGVLLGLARQDPAVRVIRQRRNAGQTAALDAGFRAARGDVLVTLDADLQNDPADIPRLLALMDRFDVVSGVRVPRRHSWLRRVSSRVANRVRNRVTHDDVTDVGCTLRACRAEFLRRVPMFAGMHRFLPTLLRMAGARTAEIPVNHRPRLHGRTKYNLGNRLWRTLRGPHGGALDADALDRPRPVGGDRPLGRKLLDRYRLSRPGSSSAAASWSNGSPPNGESGPSSPTRSGT